MAVESSWAGKSVTQAGEAVVDCPVGKGSVEWGKHRLQAVLGLEERWSCKDCDVKIAWNADLQAKWSAWVRRVLAEAADVLGDGAEKGVSK